MLSSLHEKLNVNNFVANTVSSDRILNHLNHRLNKIYIIFYKKRRQRVDDELTRGKISTIGQKAESAQIGRAHV